MLAPAIRNGQAIPMTDGEINLWVTPDAEERLPAGAAGPAQRRPWFDWSARAIFVNGMMNVPLNHMESAQALSLLQARPIIGVYNRSLGGAAGFALDLGQCIADKARLVNYQAGLLGSAETWAKATDGLFDLMRRRNPALDKRDFVGTLVDGNAATFALYALLVTMDEATRRRTPIFCHSQGNLITSNALTAVGLALGPGAIRGIEVNSYGSPCRYWPAGLDRTNHAYTFDPISVLDLRADLTSVKVGFKAAHGFNEYMKDDAEFTVNRFRWGSFGMTAAFDAAGLARFMVGMGQNPDRVRRIFERLMLRHRDEAAKVAALYVGGLNDATLAMLGQQTPDPLGVIAEALALDRGQQAQAAAARVAAAR
jgi:hypothetical protein